MTNRMFRFVIYVQLVIIFSMLLLVTVGEYVLAFVAEPSQISTAQIETGKQALPGANR